MDEGLCRWDDSSVYSDDGGKTWKPRPAGAVRLHPGEDYQCRCCALSYWQEIVDEVDEKIADIEGLDNMVAAGPGAAIQKVSKGAVIGALKDKSQVEQDKFSDEYYKAIRNRKIKSDIDTIVKNTSFTKEQITDIREHIFEKTHDLGDGRISKFDSDWRMAQAWQRLEQGKGTELDIMLLNHELEELTIMREKGYNYDDAHVEANEKYPWYQTWQEEQKK
jgi:hypothetical protein